MDSLNLLIENGADINLPDKEDVTTVTEVMRKDNVDLFECIYDIAKNHKRNMKEVTLPHLKHLERKLWLFALCSWYSTQMS